MTKTKILTIVTVAGLMLALLGIATGQEKATPQELVAKVREAASVLSKTGDVAQFNQRRGPWVWKDTYIFVHNCDTKLIAADPIQADLIGRGFMSIRDTKGNALFIRNYCQEARKASGMWSEYWWPKPGEKESSRKLTYSLGVKGTPYVVAAGIYEDTATLELTKLTSGK